MSKKRVLYLYDNFPAYRKDFFVMLNDALEQEDYQFSFYYGSKKTNSSQQEKDPPFEVMCFPIKDTMIAGADFKYFQGFKRAFKEAKPDVVVLQFHVVVLSYWWAYWYMKRHHIPYIIWDCNYTRDSLSGRMMQIRRRLTDFTYRKASAFITYGTVFRDYLLKHGRKPEEMYVAQNTINIQKILDNRSAACAERRFNHPMRILYVGALLDRKYVDSSIKAVANLVKEGYDIYYDIVGNGAEFEKLKSLIKELNVEDRIILHGAKHGEEVKTFFENDDLFLLPGTGGLAINEAMAYSLPIISTVGDDTVVDLIDGNGTLFQKFGDVDEIETALKTFIELPEEDKIKMANRSEQIVKERASLDNMVRQHLKAIKYVSKR